YVALDLVLVVRVGRGREVALVELPRLAAVLRLLVGLRDVEKVGRVLGQAVGLLERRRRVVVLGQLVVRDPLLVEVAHLVEVVAEVLLAGRRLLDLGVDRRFVRGGGDLRLVLDVQVLGRRAVAGLACGGRDPRQVLRVVGALVGLFPFLERRVVLAEVEVPLPGLGMLLDLLLDRLLFLLLGLRLRVGFPLGVDRHLTVVLAPRHARLPLEDIAGAARTQTQEHPHSRSHAAEHTRSLARRAGTDPGTSQGGGGSVARDLADLRLAWQLQSRGAKEAISCDSSPARSSSWPPWRVRERLAPRKAAYRPFPSTPSASPGGSSTRAAGRTRRRTPWATARA